MKMQKPSGGSAVRTYWSISQGFEMGLVLDVLAGFTVTYCDLERTTAFPSSIVS